MTFAMHVQDETADGHGRVPAVLHQVVPITIAALGDVLSECRQQLQRMARGKTRLGKRTPQGDRIGAAIELSKESALERVEKRELVAFGQRGMIGSIVGCPGKPIECDIGVRKRGAISSGATGKFSSCSVLLDLNSTPVLIASPEGIARALSTCRRAPANAGMRNRQ